MQLFARKRYAETMTKELLFKLTKKELLEARSQARPNTGSTRLDSCTGCILTFEQTTEHEYKELMARVP